MIKEICSLGPVIPVIEIDDANNAEPLAHALLEGGLKVIEITLRTTDALKAIENLADLPDIKIGAGTLITPENVKQAKEAGADFGVSPGSTEELIHACSNAELPFLPGAATSTEVLALAGLGFHVQKFFPAEAAGGTSMLKAVSGPIANVQFCPTGGITPETAASYLSLPNVICVGGSWIASRTLIREQNWQKITENARHANKLAR